MSSPEPMPGSVSAPFVSVLAERLWSRLPRIYRLLDGQHEWAFKRYVSGAVSFSGEVDELVEDFRGSRPIGPVSPEPWDLDPEDLERWRDARETRNSSLTDPYLALPEWLPYLAQLVGARLDVLASLQERRDTIFFATSGWKAGTAAALADAARSALTGSRFVEVQRATTGTGIAGTLWDVTLRTRASETPDAAAVLATVLRKGAKPAGVRLWHATFGTSWDIIEAKFPTWTDWEAQTWDQLEESGATYETPENLAPNPSFETDVASWTAAALGGGSVPTWAHQASGGVDGAAAGRLTKVGATGGMQVQSSVIIDARVLPARDYVFSVSAKPSVGVPLSLVVDWLNSSGGAISSTAVAVGGLTAGDWNRGLATSRHSSPALAARARLNIRFTGTVAVDTEVDVDAVLFRLVTAGGG